MTSRDQLAPTTMRSPERELRNEQGLRFERGGVVYATDGRVGTLRQVVVEQHIGQVTALVVDVDRPQVTVLVPPQAVAKTGGSAVYLSGSRQQFTAWLEHAPRVSAKQVAKANIKALLRERHGAAHDPMQSVARAGRDFVETGHAPARNPDVVRGKGTHQNRENGDADRRPFSVIGANRQ